MFETILSYVAALFSVVLAVFVLVRDRRRTFVYRSFAIGMIVLAVESVFTGLSFHAASPVDVLRWLRFRMFATALIPGIWLIFSLSFARVNYREFLSGWKWIILAAFVLPFSLVAFFGSRFFSDVLIWKTATIFLLPLGWSGYLFYLLLLVFAVIILMNLERTLRTSTGRMRWQIKFMIIGLGSLFGARIYADSQALLFRSLNISLWLIDVGALIVANALISGSLNRSRLIGVDFYLSQSFLYNSFTVVFVGIYFIAVGLMAKVATYLQSIRDIPYTAFLIFLALLCLSILLLSDRLRRRLKWFISRHFKRPLYDYRAEWSRFTESTTSMTEMKDLCNAVAKMVSKTLDMLSVTIWVVEESQSHAELCGSTVFSEAQVKDIESMEENIIELVKVISREKLPVDFDYMGDNLNVFTDKLPQDFFQTSKIRFCLPLIAGGKSLGIMTLSDRVGGDPFTIEDFDLLKTIADQAAASLLNLMLSEHLRQAKEMEAFQTMSAFFVHDLKNLASKLSLTMQNLPVHFENPEFRNDAARTISQSLSKINTMCSRLSSLSQKLELSYAESNLNDLINTVLTGLDGSIKINIIKELEPLPGIAVDAEQMQKVIINLILNAYEAIGNAGEVTVATKQREGWIEFSVRDNGCGMTKEFIETSLFHPFKTTKKQGMGIGLYHSKMIIEAHKGKIEVESEEGKGSIFRVLLPIKER